MQNQKTSINFQSKIALAWLLIGLLLPGLAFSQTPYFQGKKIRLIQGRRPGGTGDMRVRAMVPFLQKYIPGNPSIVMMYKPGGGGRIAANHLYNVARPDGLTITNIGSGFISNAVLGEHGVMYDIDKFIYLGSPNSKISYVFVSKGDLGLDTIEKLQSYRGLRVGGISVGHNIYVNARMFVWLLGLNNPKFITGYSGPELDIALMNGEVDARASIPDNIPTRTPDWIEKNLMNFHALLELPPGFRTSVPFFAKFPALHTFTRSEMEKKVLRMYTNFHMVGSPFLLPPKTPEKYVKTLRDAFSKTLKDPEFLSHFKNIVWADAQPLHWDEQEKVISDIPRNKEIIEIFKKIAGAGPLPPR